MEQLQCTESLDRRQVVGSSAEKKKQTLCQNAVATSGTAEKSTVLSQHTASSRGGSGLGIRIVRRYQTASCFYVRARGCFCSHCCAGCGHTPTMLLMTEACRCTSPSIRLEHVLASCLASLLCTCTVAMFIHCSFVLLCARACVHACGRCSIVNDISFVSATSCYMC